MNTTGQTIAQWGLNYKLLLSLVFVSARNTTGKIEKSNFKLMNFKLDILSVFLLTMVAFNCQKKQDARPAIPSSAKTVRLNSANALVDTVGNILVLRGCGFGNKVWANVAIPSTDHSAADFATIKSMNMNVSRFYLNYLTFEEDATPYQYKESGFAWIDQNIKEASQNGIYLILNMHVPQGGFQSLGTGSALWSNPENQNRLIALWKAIAKRYAKSSVIAGYGLVNEPSPVASLNQWQQLAQNIASAIRQVDPNHVLFVERAFQVAGNSSITADLNFVKINDPNTVYEFHLSDHYYYASQNWNGNPDGGSFPDSSKVMLPSNATWSKGCPNNPSAPVGTFGWTYFESGKFTATDPQIKYGLPTLSGANIGSGSVYYDSIWVNEFKRDGSLSRKKQVSVANASQWHYWSSDGSGSGVATTIGINGGQCLTISGSNTYANLSSPAFTIIPQNGFSYQICGYIKGINLQATSSAQLDIGFFKAAQPAYTLGRSYLLPNMRQYSAWGKANSAPVFLGEFGLAGSCFT